MGFVGSFHLRTNLALKFGMTDKGLSRHAVGRVMWGLQYLSTCPAHATKCTEAPYCDLVRC
jgi:hypothetical protein